MSVSLAINTSKAGQIFIHGGRLPPVKSPLEQRLADARVVWLSGNTLVGFIVSYFSVFNKLATEGCKLRMLIMSEAASADKEKLNIQVALSRLEELQRANPKMVELRYTNKQLPYSVMIVERVQGEEFAQIEFYTYRSGITYQRPHLDLTPERDPKWYNFFRDEYESLWENANSLID